MKKHKDPDRALEIRHPKPESDSATGSDLVEVKTKDLILGQWYWAVHRKDDEYVKPVACGSRDGKKFICNRWADPENDQVTELWRFFQMQVPKFPEQNR